MNIQVPNKYIYIGIGLLLLGIVIGMPIEHETEWYGKAMKTIAFAENIYGNDTSAKTVKTSPPKNVMSAEKPRMSNPASGFHTVTKEDTCYNIAKRYGSDVDAIKHLNNLDANCTLQIGQHITVARN